MTSDKFWASFIQVGQIMGVGAWGVILPFQVGGWMPLAEAPGGVWKCQAIILKTSKIGPIVRVAYFILR